MEKKKVYTVATAHLDTVWNWDFEKTIKTYIKWTMTKNFKAFRKFDNYKFNFEGAYRYELMEEYYPKLFKKLMEYVEKGRWSPCGSAYENGDVNTPSPEAIFRNILIGNGYFEKKFNKTSVDIYLPDCFGFGYALPSIIRHAGLLGFTTQKLTWGSAYGLPFDLGKWYGVAGDYCFASLNPGCYVYTFDKIRDWDFVKEKLAANEKFGFNKTYVFHGTGDIGGAPSIKSIRVMENEIKNNASSNTEVLSAEADEIFRDMEKMSEEDKSNLPEHRNELVMTNHAVGGYTSRAIGKRWNRKNEDLADMCERASVIAMHLCQKEYPEQTIDTAWKRVIAHQFHDDLPGTSLERVYARSWNDYGVSLNQFNDELNTSSSAVIGIMDTTGGGTPVVVTNSLEFIRRGVAEVEIFADFSFVKVENGAGEEQPSQIISRDGNKIKVIFSATLAPLSYETFHIFEAKKECALGGLVVTSDGIENEKYSLKLDSAGNISSIYDKTAKKEAINSPIKLGIFDYKGSKEWPAWELNYSEIAREPQHYPSLKSVEITEKGMARATLRITQTFDNSTFVSDVSLTNGGDRVEVQCNIDWQGKQKLLKVVYPMTVANPIATYDLGIGAIERGNANEKLYEVPAQKWADISADGFGVSVLSDCKGGWDKPNDNTLRLTVVHTPENQFLPESRQNLMDLGLNKFGYAIFSHTGETLKDTQKAAREFTSPPIGYICSEHVGKLGKKYSFCSVSDGGVMLKAIKKAKDSNELIVRFYEGENKTHKNVTLTFCDGIKSACEIFASEKFKANAKVKNAALTFDLQPYEVKSFALTLIPNAIQSKLNIPLPLSLPFNTRILTSNDARYRAVICGTNYSIPKELWHLDVNSGGIPFKMAPKALLADGQILRLPIDAKKVYFLAASLDGDRVANFTAGGKLQSLSIAAANEKVARWDMVSTGLKAKIKKDVVAKEITHLHSRHRDLIAKQFYIFRYEIDVASSNVIVFPKDKNIIIFSASISSEENIAYETAQLYDIL